MSTLPPKVVRLLEAAEAFTPVADLSDGYEHAVEFVVSRGWVRKVNFPLGHPYLRNPKAYKKPRHGTSLAGPVQLVLTDQGKATLAEHRLWSEERAEKRVPPQTATSELPASDGLPPNGTKLRPGERVPDEFRQYGQPDEDELTTNFIVGEGKEYWGLSRSELTKNYGAGGMLTHRIKVGREWVYLFSELKRLREAKTKRQSEREEKRKRGR